MRAASTVAMGKYGTCQQAEGGKDAMSETNQPTRTLQSETDFQQPGDGLARSFESDALAGVQLEILLRHAVARQASDLHISVGAPPVLRIDGKLHMLGGVPLSPAESQALFDDVLTPNQMEQLRVDGDVDFSYSVAELSRFRVNVYRQRGCYGAAIRVIPSHVPAMEELRLPAVFREFATRQQGLVLVTGPTGSGKSTTLASMIEYINHTAQKHILTLEDPIEYLYHHGHSIINQREVGQDTRSFPDGLRAALRQGPDVLMIGELRDLETIQTAVTAAETGHLVLATLHTMSAPQTIERIIDVFPTHQQAQIRVQLASVLVGVACQSLVPKQGGGRIAAFEILVNTPAVANLIRTGDVHQLPTVIQTGRTAGMQTLEAHLRELAQAGLVALGPT